jgi:hypothetical protein
MNIKFIVADLMVDNINSHICKKQQTQKFLFKKTKFKMWVLIFVAYMFIWI